MLNKSRLTIAAALLALGSPVMGTAAPMGSSPASAQDRPQAANHGWRADQTDGAYRLNADYFYDGIGLPQKGG
jgi:hypothetical protein